MSHARIKLCHVSCHIFLHNMGEDKALPQTPSITGQIPKGFCLLAYRPYKNELPEKMTSNYWGVAFFLPVHFCQKKTARKQLLKKKLLKETAKKPKQGTLYSRLCWLPVCC
jgi:hypothetical protein